MRRASRGYSLFAVARMCQLLLLAPPPRLLRVPKMTLLPISAPLPLLASRRGKAVSCCSMRRMVTPESNSSHARAPHEPSLGAEWAGSAARKFSMHGSSSSTSTDAMFYQVSGTELARRAHQHPPLLSPPPHLTKFALSHKQDQNQNSRHKQVRFPHRPFLIFSFFFAFSHPMI
jgi:hypothetical protein